MGCYVMEMQLMLKSMVNISIQTNRCLDLPERLELPERPPKYRKDQRIIGNPLSLCLVTFSPVCGEKHLVCSLPLCFYRFKYLTISSYLVYDKLD